jgi:hypothetical protein
MTGVRLWRRGDGAPMTTMIAEVYDAPVEAGASQEKARKAAEAIAGYETRFAAIEVRLEWTERLPC